MSSLAERERLPAPPAVQEQLEARRALGAVAQWFALPIGGVALLLGGAVLLHGPMAERLVLWLGTLAAGLVVLLVGFEVLLWYRLSRAAKREIGPYDYDWIERAQSEQPRVGEIAKQRLVERGAVTVADLVALWRLYVAEQRRSYDERRRAARRRCARALGLRPIGRAGAAGQKEQKVHAVDVSRQQQTGTDG